MEGTLNSVGHIVAVVPWVAFLLGVAWYAVKGLVVDLRDERARVASAGSPTERARSHRPVPERHVARRVPAAR